MNSLLKAGIIFFVGGGVGALTAWKITSMKYEKLIDEEVASVKETYCKRVTDAKNDETNDIKKSIDYPEEYVTFVKDYSSVKETVEESTPSEDNDIYIITEEQFTDTMKFYDKTSIIRYADGVWTDEEDCPIEGEVCVGQLFDEVADGFDGVEYVRNEAMSTDYEVIFSAELYGETLDEESDE